jgi:hypothetical protein
VATESCDERLQRLPTDQNLPQFFKIFELVAERKRAPVFAKNTSSPKIFAHQRLNNHNSTVSTMLMMIEVASGK